MLIPVLTVEQRPGPRMCMSCVSSEVMRTSFIAHSTILYLTLDGEAFSMDGLIW